MAEYPYPDVLGIRCILIEILKYCNVKDILNMSLMNKNINEICYEDCVWRQKCEEKDLICERDHIQMYESYKEIYMMVFKCEQLFKARIEACNTLIPQYEGEDMEANRKFTPIPDYISLVLLLRGERLNKLPNMPKISCSKWSGRVKFETIKILHDKKISNIIFETYFQEIGILQLVKDWIQEYEKKKKTRFVNIHNACDIVNYSGTYRKMCTFHEQWVCEFTIKKLLKERHIKRQIGRKRCQTSTFESTVREEKNKLEKLFQEEILKSILIKKAEIDNDYKFITNRKCIDDLKGLIYDISEIENIRAAKAAEFRRRDRILHEAARDELLFTERYGFG